MKKLSLALAVLSLLVVAAPASATHSWGGYHWARTAAPFTLQLGDNVGSAWDESLQLAAVDWSLDEQTPRVDLMNHPFATSPVNTVVVAGKNIGREKRCPAASGRVEVCNARYGNNGWLGVASVWASGGHIVQATVKLNDTYYSTTKYNNATWRAAVTCQEIGHTFGLDHQSESGADFRTCMDYANSPDADNMHPNQGDYSMLGSIYSHGDSSTTVTSAPAGSGRGLRRVRDDLFVEDTTTGGKHYVFVYWVQRGGHYSPPADH